MFFCRGRYCFLGNRHQPSRSSGLGDDAKLLRASFHAGSRETGQVWWNSAILCNRSANRVKETSWKFRLQVGLSIPSDPLNRPSCVYLGVHAAHRSCVVDIWIWFWHLCMVDHGIFPLQKVLIEFKKVNEFFGLFEVHWSVLHLVNAFSLSILAWISKKIVAVIVSFFPNTPSEDQI